MKANYRYFGILAALVVLILSSAACSFSAVDLKSGTARINVTLQENEINHLLDRSTNHVEDSDFLLREITKVELNDGFIRVFGTYDKQDGREATGSYDVVLRADNGELKAEITGVDIEGVELNDSRIQRLNEEMADSLTRSARDSRGEVEFESVDITGSAVTMQVKTMWETK